MNAVIFPGQGSQCVGMGGELFDSVAEFAQQETQIDNLLGFSVRETCLYDKHSLLSDTRYTQPCLYLVNALHYFNTRSKSLEPTYLAGHSLGEYNALLVSGAFDLLTGLKLVKKRSELMAQANGGSMAAVIGLKPNEIKQALSSENINNVILANYNGRLQTVISGPKEQIELAAPVLESFGAQLCIPLSVSGAFHSQHMSEAAREFKKFIGQFTFNELSIPVISNATGEPYPLGNAQEDIPNLLVTQIDNPVLWEQSIQYMRDNKVKNFIELGPGNVLSKLIEQDEKLSDPTTLETPSRNKGIQELAEHLIKSVLNEILDIPCEEIGLNTQLQDYGVSSVEIMMITEELEKDFGSLPVTLLYECPTVDSLINFFTENYIETLEAINDKSKKESLIEDQEEQSETQKSNARLHNDDSATSKSDASTFQCDYGDVSDNDIAIIGISGRYPQADNLEEYWENLKNGTDCITEIPKERWDHDRYFNKRKTVHGKEYSRWGGFIKGIDNFDPLFFKISPREAFIMDPQERLLLQGVHHAIEDAGYTQDSLNHPNDNSQEQNNVGVYVGITTMEYQLHAAQQQMTGRHTVLSGNPASVANRISYFGNFQGPSLTLDTMCSSSITAIHIACESLRSGSSSIAIACGANLSPHPNKYMLLGQANFTSTSGRCKAFGVGGDGYVPSEGIGVVILKPLKQAIKDHDNIHGVIKATSINHGGRANSYTAPNPNSQSKVIIDAIKRSGVNPKHINYVEAHGTGTSIGDPIELSGLTKAYRQYTDENQYCAIGSVKSTIGHCESAAGIAGLTKILLQMKHKALAPSIHCDELNPGIDFEKTPFKVQRELTKWENIIDEETTHPLYSALSSFGAGGSNAHLILSDYPKSETRKGNLNKPYIFVLSARNEERLLTLTKQFLASMETLKNSVPIEDVSFTLSTGRESMAARVGVIASNYTELKESLENYLAANKTSQDFYHGLNNPVKDAAKIDSLNINLRGMVPSWIKDKNFDELLKNWVNGAEIPWKNLYKKSSPYRVSLPGYPFEKLPFWVDNSLGEISEDNSDTKNKENPESRDKENNNFIDRILHDNINESDFMDWVETN